MPQSKVGVVLGLIHKFLYNCKIFVFRWSDVILLKLLHFSYANNESYNRAIEDFEEALKENPRHVNAKKYLCETLAQAHR